MVSGYAELAVEEGELEQVAQGIGGADRHGIVHLLAVADVSALGVEGGGIGLWRRGGLIQCTEEAGAGETGWLGSGLGGRWIGDSGENGEREAILARFGLAPG